MAIETKCVHLLLLVLASVHVRIGSAQYSCTLSDGRRGICIVLQQCNSATDLIRQYGIGNPTVRQFLQNNGCGFEGNSQKVCCPQDQGSTGGNNQGNRGQQTNPASVLPNSCGVGGSDRIIGGTETELGEFPWMANIEYLEYGQTLMLGCGGSLISKRYVLTAAHCIRNIPSTWQVRGVRLGEHLVGSDPDCVYDAYGRQTCAPSAISVPYEDIIVHEQYGNPAQFRNDIALIRLAYDVQTTPYVQPICLPLDGSIAQRYWSAGWGQTNTQRSSEVKLKVSLNYADLGQCAQRYSTRRVVLGDGQMCAGGTAGQDTCKGDSGGPLMKLARGRDGRDRWHVDGVVSIGHTPCGLDGWPGVYTKVFDYVPWIMSKLQP